MKDEMKAITSEEMAELKGKVGGGDDLQAIAQQVNAGLNKLADAMNASKDVVSDEEKMKMQSLIDQFDDLSGALMGEPEMEEEAPMKEMPVMGGLKGKLMGPQDRQ